jgi:hypothetical protein
MAFYGMIKQEGIAQLERPLSRGAFDIFPVDFFIQGLKIK